MNIKPVTANLAVTEQITAVDIEKIKTAGYHTVICNRPDGEGADQPTSAEIQQAAEAAGLEFHYLPVISGKILTEQVTQFQHLKESVAGPILAYCRTGTRSIILWALSERSNYSIEKLLKVTSDAGFNISADALACQ